MRCQVDAVGRENRPVSTGDMRKTSQLVFPGRTGEPGQSHEGEIASDRVADTFLQIQLDLTAA